ncbi:glycosyltransferase [Wenxinia marina]|uniref:ADP-heptose:LPS heptosyltransferase n=1 Tax=Wenxinia marina DSM 24838 TaxID=1123501 RepID=A0A0D0QAD4_9RHOB|nr:glycosyltransferase [Wenxinia marina]KIQ71434.1 ADP-heptose:LPS heptosyltransferase [Wenxinia marina DSM 24838]GGL78964.1 hypothetical protein GCM10011392_36840 [Wenxinia marina]
MPRSENFVLLVNTRHEKGFDLILKVAALRPDIPFVAIANQSSLDLAEADVRQRGLQNIEIVGKVEDMAPLYRAARVVAVPSYRFKETFSRVCIEAHRFGKPVLGADSGNIPNLLKEAGIVLPEDPKVWAAELGRLYGEEAYYDGRVALAHENSERYSQERQRHAFTDLIGSTETPILVGVGSGLGNILHCGPMIRRIAEHFGTRVDVVITIAPPGSLGLLQNSRHVGAVYMLKDFVLEKYYDTVLLTHSFGGTKPNFNARAVHYSRDWNMFRPGRSEHETIHNLRTAEHFLGVPFEEEDARAHFVGEFGHDWHDSRIVGIHGGSKPGYWDSKRWNGFPALAERLTGEGFDVRSYGMPDEYIPGTRDCTGGSIEEMVAAIGECSYFMANDNGGMNIANALGIPVLSVFAPTEVATRAPLGRWNRVVSVDKDCAPCEVKDIEKFRSGTCACIEEITVDEVHRAFHEMRYARRGTAAVEGTDIVTGDAAE